MGGRAYELLVKLAYSPIIYWICLFWAILVFFVISVFLGKTLGFVGALFLSMIPMVILRNGILPIMEHRLSEARWPETTSIPVLDPKTGEPLPLSITHTAWVPPFDVPERFESYLRKGETSLDIAPGYDEAGNEGDLLATNERFLFVDLQGKTSKEARYRDILRVDIKDVDLTDTGLGIFAELSIKMSERELKFLVGHRAVQSLRRIWRNHKK